MDLYHFCSEAIALRSRSVDGQSFFVKTNPVVTGVGAGLHELSPDLTIRARIAFVCVMRRTFLLLSR